MKGLIFSTLLITVSSSAVMANQCGLDSFSESQLRLGSYYRSQAATSLNVNCSQAYTIKFASQNLVSSDGASFVSNGAYKLKARMSISGATRNLWNVPLSAQGSNKYVVAVQLEDAPSIRVPAGRYTDMIYVNLSF